MKRNFVYLSLTGLIVIMVVLSTDAVAQINLKSINVGASYWKPALDYWNNQSFLTQYNQEKGAKLNGRVMPTATIELGLSGGFSIGARAGYWTNSVSSNLSVASINRSEKLTLAIIPVSLDLLYRFEPKKSTTQTTDADGKSSSPKNPFLIPYIGVGLSRYFITNTFSRQVVSNTGSVDEKQSGNTYGVQVFVGAEKKIVKMLYVALDVRYHLGNYNQQVQADTDAAITTQKVSLNGLEAGLSLRAKFNR